MVTDAVHMPPSCRSRHGSVPAPMGSVMLRIPTVAMTHLLKGFLEHTTHSSSALPWVLLHVSPASLSTARTLWDTG